MLCLSVVLVAWMVMGRNIPLSAKCSIRLALAVGSGARQRILIGRCPSAEEKPAHLGVKAAAARAHVMPWWWWTQYMVWAASRRHDPHPLHPPASAIRVPRVDPGSDSPDPCGARATGSCSGAVMGPAPATSGPARVIYIAIQYERIATQPPLPAVI